MKYIDEYLFGQARRCFALLNNERFPETEQEIEMCKQVAQMLKESVYQTGIYEGQVLAYESTMKHSQNEIRFPIERINMTDSRWERKLKAK